MLTTSAPPAVQQQPANASNNGSQGAWTDEEQERLKDLAEQSKSIGNAGSIEWDWVINQWGPSRTRSVKL